MNDAEIPNEAVATAHTVTLMVEEYKYLLKRSVALEAVYALLDGVSVGWERREPLNAIFAYVGLTTKCADCSKHRGTDFV